MFLRPEPDNKHMAGSKGGQKAPEQPETRAGETVSAAVKLFKITPDRSYLLVNKLITNGQAAF